MTNITETWRPVNGYEGFCEVSDLGRVRSRRGIITPQPDKNGYLRVRLCRRDGTRKWHPVHRLVLITFCGVCADRPECNHKDLNKQNNTLANLEWTSRNENAAHAMKLGAYDCHIGEKNTQAKLTEEDVTKIHSMIGNYTQKVISRRFGVSDATVSAIKTGRLWSHRLPPPRKLTAP